MNMKRNKKIIGISCFVLLLLVGIIYGYMHSINIYRLEVTQIEGSGYGYKIYERERLKWQRKKANILRRRMRI